jgi:hypothetical protein
MTKIFAIVKNLGIFILPNILNSFQRDGQLIESS